MWLPFQKLHPLGYAGEYMTAGACTHKCRAFGLVFSSMTHKWGNSFWNAFLRHQKGFIPEVWRAFHKFHPSGYARARVRAVVNTFEWEALGLVFWHWGNYFSVLRSIFFRAGPHTDVMFICCPLSGFLISSVFSSAWLHLKLYSTSATLFVQYLRW